MPFTHSSFLTFPISRVPSSHASTSGPAPSIATSASTHRRSSPSGPIVSGSSASAYTLNNASARAGVYDSLVAEGFDATGLRGAGGAGLAAGAGAVVGASAAGSGSEVAETLEVDAPGPLDARLRV